MTKRTENISSLVLFDDSKAPEWLAAMDWEQYEKFAAIGYSPEQIAMYYRINKHEFMYFYMLVDSPLEMHYQRGILFHQANEGIVMMDAAATNATQAQRLDKLRELVNFQNVRDEILYGGF